MANIAELKADTLNTATNLLNARNAHVKAVEDYIRAIVADAYPTATELIVYPEATGDDYLATTLYLDAINDADGTDLLSPEGDIDWNVLATLDDLIMELDCDPLYLSGKRNVIRIR